MPLAPDTVKVAAKFSRAAAEYDRWATAQKAIAGRLCNVLPPPAGVRRVLELGCGTGLLTKLLRRRYGEAHIQAIDVAPGMIDFCVRMWPGGGLADFTVADAQRFVPVRAVDLVASSSSFQWFAERREAMACARRSLSKHGRLALAVPVAGTLPELARRYRQVTGREMPGLDLWPEEAYLRSMTDNDLPPAVVTVETMAFTFADGWQVLRALRGIGATFGGYRGIRPLSRSELGELVQDYEGACSVEGGVRATYRVLFAVSEPTR